MAQGASCSRASRKSAKKRQIGYTHPIRVRVKVRVKVKVKVRVKVKVKVRVNVRVSILLILSSVCIQTHCQLHSNLFFSREVSR